MLDCIVRGSWQRRQTAGSDNESVHPGNTKIHPGLLLLTKAPIVTSNSMDFSFVLSAKISQQVEATDAKGHNLHLVSYFQFPVFCGSSTL